MKPILFILFGMFFHCGLAFAKTPPEILKPYKEYRAALKSGDKNEAFNQARTAWQKAEIILGDSKLTGDLALNFSVLPLDFPDNTVKNYNRQMKAHKRAIELAKYYEAEESDMTLERHLKRLETTLAFSRIQLGKFTLGGEYKYFKDMEMALEKFGYQGSTYEGDMEALKTHHFQLKGKYEKALKSAQRAEAIYAARTDGLVTHYPYLLNLYKGDTLRKSGKPIDALLSYQGLMQNLKGELSSDHPFVKRAFAEWVSVRSELEESGQLEEAEAAGLCKCWPYEDYTNQSEPLLQVPPIMPRNALRSGLVNLVFDLNDKGHPDNIRVLSSTEKTFEGAAIRALKKWRYTALNDTTTDTRRTDLTTKMTFKLTRGNTGRLIAERKLKTKKSQ